MGLTTLEQETTTSMGADGDLGVLDLRCGPFLRGAVVVQNSLFGGSGGLRRSRQRLRVRVVLTVCVELEAALRRAVRLAYPGCVELVDVRKVSRRLIEQILRAAVEAGATLCATGGGLMSQ